jgi:hypothetical protein
MECATSIEKLNIYILYMIVSGMGFIISGDNEDNNDNVGSASSPVDD